MSGSSCNLAQLSSTILKAHSESIYGNTRATQSPGGDYDVIVRNTISQDNQDLFPSGVGIGFEQVAGSPSDC